MLGVLGVGRGVRIVVEEERDEKAGMTRSSQSSTRKSAEDGEDAGTIAGEPEVAKE